MGRLRTFHIDRIENGTVVAAAPAIHPKACFRTRKDERKRYLGRTSFGCQPIGSKKVTLITPYLPEELPRPILRATNVGHSWRTLLLIASTKIFD